MAQQRFPIRFTGADKAMAVLGLRASNSYLEIDGDTVPVLGVPVRLQVLRIAVADPAAMCEELATPAPA